MNILTCTDNCCYDKKPISYTCTPLWQQTFVIVLEYFFIAWAKILSLKNAVLENFTVFISKKCTYFKVYLSLSNDVSVTKELPVTKQTDQNLSTVNYKSY